MCVCFRMMPSSQSIPPNSQSSPYPSSSLGLPHTVIPPPISMNPSALTSESITDILNVPLQDLQTLSQTLFHSLSPTQARPPPVPPLQAFLDVDARLAEAVKLARIHQIRQRQIERLKDEVVKLEEGWRDSVKELMDGKTLLEGVLAEADERVKAIEEAKAGTFISS